jgi:hypothetical protein
MRIQPGMAYPEAGAISRIRMGISGAATTANFLFILNIFLNNFVYYISKISRSISKWNPTPPDNV